MAKSVQRAYILDISIYPELFDSFLLRNTEIAESSCQLSSFGLSVLKITQTNMVNFFFFCFVFLAKRNEKICRKGRNTCTLELISGFKSRFRLLIICSDIFLNVKVKLPQRVPICCIKNYYILGCEICLLFPVN